MNIKLEESGNEVWIDVASIQVVGEIEHICHRENWFTRLFGYEDVDHYRFSIYTSSKWELRVIRTNYDDAKEIRDKIILRKQS